MTINKLSIFIFIIISHWACNKENKVVTLESLQKQELSKGIRNDDLFLGLKFGMTSEAFYQHCWDLNKKQIIKEGKNNTSVLYRPQADFKHPVSMNFYPTFINDKIAELPILFEYDNWSPLNPEVQSDKLVVEVIKYFEKMFGKGFTRATDNLGDGIVIVKIDGNRQIKVVKLPDGVVRVIMSDLTAIK